MGYQKRVSLIKNGQDVSAGVANTPLRVLQQNIEYLKARLDAAETGQTIYAREVTVETGANVGMPVYFNAVTSRFERAIAGLEQDAVTGEFVVSSKSQPWGVVAEKHSATSADILLYGYATLDISAAVDGDVTAGIYWLSGQTPGKLVKTRAGVSTIVLKSDGDGRVLVQPQLRESLEDHRHYRFELVCRPAGDVTPPSPGDRHEIVDPDTSVEGWLPASHPIFEGAAPANAVFGYNISQAAWAPLWPPIPLEDAYLEWDRGTDKTKMGQAVPLGSDGQVLIDTNGIWWLSDCYEDVPWPAALDTADPDTEPTSDESDEIECPRNLYMRLTLWFTRLIFKTSQAMVTSLRAKAGSRLSVTCYPTTDAAVTGDLELDLDLDFVASDDAELGSLVFKELTGSTFSRGRVLEGIKVSGSNITISASHTRRETPDDVTTPLIYQGIVSLAVLNDLDGRELPIELVRSTGVSEEFYQDLPALGMPTGRQSEFRGKVRIPIDGVADGTTMKLRLWVLGRVDGTLPDLEVSYRRIPLATTTPQTLPTSDTDLDDVTGVAVDADQYALLESETFEVEAGDAVFFTVRRLSDGYTGEIQLIDYKGVLVVA